MEFDLLIVGGGGAGMSCVLEKPFASKKKVGIILHQKASHLQSALFNNVLGIKQGTTGMEILRQGPAQLENLYPKITQLKKEKVSHIEPFKAGFQLITNKNKYAAAKVVLAVGYTEPLGISGMEEYCIPHKKAKTSKNRIQLINDDHLVSPGLYVAGTLAGWRSQFSIACGSGASIATDILTEWNSVQHTKVHDKLI